MILLGLVQVGKLVEECNLIQKVEYVCYDNGCHLDKHINNSQYNYNSETKKIKFFIDRFHIRNHKQCGKYSLDIDEKMNTFNSSACEQLFYICGLFKHITKHMSKYHFNFFYLIIFDSLNKKRVKVAN